MTTVTVPGTVTRVKKVVVGTPVRRVTAAGSISDFGDVNVTNLENGSILIYNTSLSQWVAQRDLDSQNMDGGSF